MERNDILSLENMISEMVEKEVKAGFNPVSNVYKQLAMWLIELKYYRDIIYGEDIE